MSIRKMSLVLAVLALSVPAGMSVSVGQQQSGEEVARQALIKAQAEKEANDRKVREQEAEKKRQQEEAERIRKAEERARTCAVTPKPAGCT